jgi:hypothetical protein
MNTRFLLFAPVSGALCAQSAVDVPFHAAATECNESLALPFGYLQVRAGSIGYKVFAGIMLGVTFHFMNGLFSHLGLLNTWPAWLSVSIPSLAALTVALAMLARVGRMR